MYFDKINNDVAFRESDHKYFNIKFPDLNYTSVTTLISKFHEKFDADFFSKYKTFEKFCDPNVFKTLKSKLLLTKQFKPDYLDLIDISQEEFDIEVERLLLSWNLINKEACDIGTAYHLEKENLWYNQANDLVKKVLPVEGDFACIKSDYSLNKEKVVIPEYLIYYSCSEKILNLAGQVDLLIKDGNDIYILDYKTNAKGITSKAFFDSRTGTTKRMHYPINNLEDTTLNHYTIQLSLYAWMLQKINPDFNIKLLKLLHIDRNGVETEFEVPYLKEDVTRLLKYYKKSLKDEAFKNMHKNLH